MAGGNFPGGNRLIFTGVAWSPPNHDHYDFRGGTRHRHLQRPSFCVNPNGDFETDYDFATYKGDVVNQDKEFLTHISRWAGEPLTSSCGSQRHTSRRGRDRTGPDRCVGTTCRGTKTA